MQAVPGDLHVAFASMPDSYQEMIFR
jgi:hypothetical protein